jgi:hypothetical protein
VFRWASSRLNGRILLAREPLAQEVAGELGDGKQSEFLHHAAAKTFGEFYDDARCGGDFRWTAKAAAGSVTALATCAGPMGKGLRAGAETKTGEGRGSLIVLFAALIGRKT